MRRLRKLVSAKLNTFRHGSPLREKIRKAKQGLPTLNTSEISNEYREVAQFWTSNNVTLHRKFASAEESLEYLNWRNDQYLGYIELMPFSCDKGDVVLDFGCGPGHDMVGFITESQAGRIIGADVSTASLEECESRCRLHNKPFELIKLSPDNPTLPLETSSIDVIHSSGVIHHITDPMPTLRELRRIIKPNGKFRCMVYNRESLFFHLYVAWMVRYEQNRYASLSAENAFTHLTDGEGCPVSRAWTPREFTDMVHSVGFNGGHTGNGISVFELQHQLRRFEAIQDMQLETEHREFLRDIRNNPEGFPITPNGQIAGVDACYEFLPE